MSRNDPRLIGDLGPLMPPGWSLIVALLVAGATAGATWVIGNHVSSTYDQLGRPLSSIGHGLFAGMLVSLGVVRSRIVRARREFPPNFAAPQHDLDVFWEAPIAYYSEHEDRFTADELDKRIVDHCGIWRVRAMNRTSVWIALAAIPAVLGFLESIRELNVEFKNELPDFSHVALPLMAGSIESLLVAIFGLTLYYECDAVMSNWLIEARKFLDGRRANLAAAGDCAPVRQVTAAGGKKAPSAEASRITPVPDSIPDTVMPQRGSIDIGDDDGGGPISVTI